jgi:hypothetical protein
MDPFDNPVVAMLPRVEAKGVVDQWLKDTLPATSVIDTGIPEGADFVPLALVNPSRDVNYTMIFRADVQVSETTRAVEKAGFSDSYAYHIGKYTKTLGNKLETVALDPTVSLQTSDPRIMKPLPGFLDTAATRLTLGAGTPVSSISEPEFNDAMQQLWVNGGEIKVAVVGDDTIRQIQTFLGIAKSVASVTDIGNRRLIDAQDATLYASIEFYRSPFGLLTLVLDRWMPDDVNTPANSRIYFIDRSKAALAWLRPMTHTLLGKVGDSVRGIIVGEVTTRVYHEKAHFMVKGAA